ncbi:M12 family metallo-peptidase [Kaistella montana]|uniref:M12 family metallo-peptidase n=1 Tax=Kaistella montana TaxID=1849733 RepID=A0ABW5K5L9_9FLAO|nr:M12 family metallo-peptidase [Kaistella montana]MCQ4034474.1 M12 family metallo-peptidase [Kaistella montana]
MKRIFQLCFGLAFFSFGYSQDLKPIAEKVKSSHIAKKTFVKYSPFTVDSLLEKQVTYRTAAEGITVMKLRKTELQKINSEKPDAMQMDFLFEGKNITVELVKNNFFTQDFKVNTDKGYINYTPGVYYQGIVKGDNESLVAISFFKDDIVGVTSIKNVGNIVIGKSKTADEFVSYNDQKLKGENPFSCSADELAENQKLPTLSFDSKTMIANKTDNCVRIFYEAGYGPYTQNGSNVAKTTNWVTSMHNNISTLYANDGITVALSEVMVWTKTDPYSGTPSNILNQFRNTRTSFNGDIAQLLRNPATTSIAWVNALCTTYKYSYSGVNLAYANVPTYSWNIEAMTHEIGHNLGSPHTHACNWNGNNTAIDGCGPASGNDEGCDGALPTETGGTIMSYCHLVSSVGINFANGFGPQPGALIRATVNSKGCLGTDCITSCESTITGLAISNGTTNSVTATIVDNVATGWKYKLAKMDGTVITSGTTSNKVLNFNNLNGGTYYNVSVGTECSGPQAFDYEQLIFTDANWCSGVAFSDPGSAEANYGDNQIITKTFYPTNSNEKLKLTFTQFDTEQGYDFMNIYNGPTTESPGFANGTQLSGNTIPGPFTSTHATGAITVRFISDSRVTATGWNSNFECLTLATDETAASASVSISQSSVKGIFDIKSKDKILFYSVFDASGKLVKNNAKSNSTEEKVDLAAFPKGTYVVSVTTSKETVTKKVIR